MSGAVFLVAGALSGLLLNERGGVLGAIEWGLRTLVVLAAAVFIVATLVLVLRVRRRLRSRVLGWLLGVVAALGFAWFVAIPVGFGVYLTHVPVRRAVENVDVGAPKQPVTIAGADGNRLRGWYVRSRNGAAVIALHGTGSNRLGVERHTRLLARHGYGVLALDLRGHGDSTGRSTSLPWRLDDDLDAALEWLRARAEVEPRKLALLGVSLGGEVAVRVAARRRDVRATVAEGIRGSTADAREAGTPAVVVAQLAGLEAVSVLLGGSGTGPSDAETVERLADRPLLLISAGRSDELKANRVFARRAGRRAEHWNLPDAPHAAAARVAPGEYGRRVIAFLDRALTPRSRRP